MRKYESKYNMRYARRLNLIGLNYRDISILGCVIRDEVEAMNAYNHKIGVSALMKEKAISLIGKLLNFSGFYGDDLLVKSIYLLPQASTLMCQSIDGKRQLIHFTSEQSEKEKTIDIIEKDSVTTIAFTLEGKRHKKGIINITNRHLEAHDPLRELYQKAYPSIELEGEDSLEKVGEQTIRERIDELQGIRDTLMENSAMPTRPTTGEKTI